MKYLPWIMSQLLAYAFQNGAASTTLKNGLRVSIRSELARTYLYLSRPNTYPSETELLTVLKALPYTVAAAAKQRAYKGRYYIFCSWPKQDNLFSGSPETLGTPATPEPLKGSQGFQGPQDLEPVNGKI